MTTLGIDPGMAAWGFGVVRRAGNRLKVLEYGSHRTASDERSELRLKQIHDEMVSILERHEPEAVALEDSYVGANPRTALSVGQARGAILVACASAGVRCTEYPPSAVKQAVCGYGRADKAQVQRMVRSILQLEGDPRPHHASDALAVAICHALAAPMPEAAGGRRS